jgi:hypothetical protein
MFRIGIVRGVVAASIAVLVVACSGGGGDDGQGSCTSCTLPVRSSQVTDTSPSSDADDASVPPSPPVPMGKKPGDMPSPDAATSLPPGSGSVLCGAVSCSGGTPVCCINHDDIGTCVSKTAPCTDNIALECDQRSDCTAGALCCGTTSTRRAVCTTTTTCAGNDEYLICTTDADCAPGKTCKTAFFSKLVKICN